MDGETLVIVLFTIGLAIMYLIGIIDYIFGEYIDANFKSEEIKKYKIIDIEDDITEWVVGYRSYSKALNSYYAILQSEDSRFTIKIRRCYGDYIGRECVIKSKRDKYCRNKFEMVRVDLLGVIRKVLYTSIFIALSIVCFI